MVWLPTTTRDLLDDIYRCSFKRQTGVSLKYIIDFGQYPIERQMLVSAQFLHKVRARPVHAMRLRSCSSVSPPTLPADKPLGPSRTRVSCRPWCWDRALCASAVR